MNTTLVIRYEDGDVEAERQRTSEEKNAYWSLVETWLAKNGTTRIEVKLIDSSDECTVCYNVTPEAV